MLRRQLLGVHVGDCMHAHESLSCWGDFVHHRAVDLHRHRVERVERHSLRNEPGLLPGRVCGLRVRRVVHADQPLPYGGDVVRQRPVDVHRHRFERDEWHRLRSESGVLSRRVHGLRIRHVMHADQSLPYGGDVVRWWPVDVHRHRVERSEWHHVRYESSLLSRRVHGLRVRRVMHADQPLPYGSDHVYHRAVHLRGHGSKRGERYHVRNESGLLSRRLRGLCVRCVVHSDQSLPYGCFFVRYGAVDVHGQRRERHQRHDLWDQPSVLCRGLHGVHGRYGLHASESLP